MLVTLLVKFRNKDCKTTELGLLLQVLPVRIVTFVETLGSHLKLCKVAGALKHREIAGWNYREFLHSLVVLYRAY